MRLWFHMQRLFLHYLFLIFHSSFGDSRGLCFMIVDFFGIFHYSFGYSQTCVKQAPFGKPNWLLKTGACLIQVDFHLFAFNGI